MSKNSRLKFLFQKYLDKSISDREYHELMLLINDGDYDEQVIRLIDEAAIEFPCEQLNPVKSEAIIDTILNSDGDKINDGFRKSQKIWLYLAASILTFIAVGILWLKQGPSGKTLVKIIHSKSMDDHQKIRLDDGTFVVLNKNSTIEYPDKFTGPTREVTLHGEAYFDIRHKDHQPFIVHAGRLIVNVLGTAFNVKVNTSADKVEVTVTRGKVSVIEDHRLIATLMPNRQIKVDSKKSKSEQISVDAAESIAWQAKDLFFDDVTMDSAMQILGKHFNRAIEFDNEQVKQCSLTGAFTHGENLEQILKVICSFNNAQFRITQEGTIKVSGSGCK
jgi:transmembrane sensor